MYAFVHIVIAFCLGWKGGLTFGRELSARTLQVCELTIPHKMKETYVLPLGLCLFLVYVLCLSWIRFIDLSIGLLEVSCGIYS